MILNLYRWISVLLCSHSSMMPSESKKCSISLDFCGVLFCPGLELVDSSFTLSLETEMINKKYS